MIRLEQFQEKDFSQLIKWVSDEEILMNWSGSLFRFPLSVSSLQWYIQDTNVLNDSEAFVYKAIDKEGNSIGHISLGGISWKNKSARITRVLIGDTTHHGKGQCQFMIKEALRIAFSELNLHRVSLGVYLDNTAATRCYQKAGFVSEGIQREILWYKDAWWSMQEMSILASEWHQLNP